MKIRKVLKERWKFYLAVYILGYIISLFATGVPNMIYLIPIKLSAILLVIIIGNAFYHASKRMSVYRYPVKGLKYVLIIGIIMIIFNLMKIGLLQLDIDITPLIGFST